MMQFVVSETRIEDIWESCHSHVVGVTSSLELAVQRVMEKFEGFVMENRQELDTGGLRFAMRGKVVYQAEEGEEAEDEYYSILIQSFPLDPSRFGRDGESEQNFVEPAPSETAIASVFRKAQESAASDQTKK